MELSSNQRQVIFFHPAALEGHRERPMRGGAQGEQKDPRGVSIQAMDDEQPSPELLLQHFANRSLAARYPGGDHHRTGWFVDRDEARRLEEDLERFH